MALTMKSYILSQECTLECIIKKRQLAFWTKLKNNIQNRVLSRILDIGNEHNLEFITYYKNLELQYASPENCEKMLKMKYDEIWKQKLEDNAREDIDSKLGTYYDINPNCNSEHMKNYIDMLELERITLTRFRTGSHNLKIETGRHNKIQREQRLCKCNQSIQTLRHIILSCNLLDEIRPSDIFNSCENFFQWNGAANYLIKATKIFKIKT